MQLEKVEKRGSDTARELDLKKTQEEKMAEELKYEKSHQDITYKILKYNPMPGNKNDVAFSFYIRENDGDLIADLNQLEKNGVCRSTEECIRRILTWFLKEEGFL